jgi:hypothetical protein
MLHRVESLEELQAKTSAAGRSLAAGSVSRSTLNFVQDAEEVLVCLRQA